MQVALLLIIKLSGIVSADDTAYTIKNFNGYLKQVANQKSEHGDEIFKCWKSSVTYYNTHGEGKVFVTFDNLCEDDSRYYQVCGHLPISGTGTWNYNTTTDSPHCLYYPCDYQGTIKAGELVLPEVHCNGKKICENGAVNLRLCNSTINVKCDKNSDKMVEKSKQCDGVEDCDLGTDELGCEDVYNQITCTPKDPFVAMLHEKMWVPPVSLCKENPALDDTFCRDGEDQSDETCGTSKVVGSCEVDKVTEDGITKTTNRTLHDLQKCAPYSKLANQRVCHDGGDQINCTNREIFFNCTHKQHPQNTITLTDNVLCENLDLCQDNLTNKCEIPEANCLKHRHFICDGIEHCDNGLDELNCERKCSNSFCFRKVRNHTIQEPEKQCILTSWVLDHVEDCDNGEDEDKSLWTECKYEGTEDSLWIPKGEQCVSKLFCPSESPGKMLKSPKYLCRGIDCMLGNTSICRETRKRDAQVKLLKHDSVEESLGSTHFIPPCLPGIFKEGECIKSIYEESFGTVPSTIITPVNNGMYIRCKNIFGEAYVYASYLGICKEDNDIELKSLISKVNYLKSCPGMPDRILTLTKQNDLTFVSQFSANNFLNKEVFQCSNGMCLESFAQVCDLNDDCGDNSDEKHCKNHFSCNVNDSHTEIIYYSQVCDGFIDCSTATDECNDDCPSQNNKKIIKPVFLQVIAWVFGILATLFNAIIIFNNSQKLIKQPRINFNRIKYTVTVLVTLVALGDFLIGLYLVSMSIENVTRYDNFCKNERKWLASLPCEFYGVLSTVGSQLSMFALTVMSLYRAIAMKNTTTSSRPTRKFYAVTITYVIVLILFSLLVAVLPIITTLEDIYFYNGYMAYLTDHSGNTHTNNNMFTEYYQENAFYRNLLKKYYNDTYHKDTRLDIFAIKESINKMFKFPMGSSNQEMNFETLGFYGSSGSCTFKFFVDPEDPQKAYTWTILTLNMTCLVIVALSYFTVHAISQGSASKVGGTKRFGRLQKKISLIIITDFLCLFPFIIVCMLHYTHAIAATGLYPLFSVFILPINSVLNPILYSDHLFSAVINEAYGMATDVGHTMVNFVSERMDNIVISPEIPEIIMEENEQEDQEVVICNTTIL